MTARNSGAIPVYVRSMGDPNQPTPGKKPLPAAAERALAEAAARRAELDRQAAERPKEAGRKGLDPTRYGDWENKGIASDF